MTTFTKLSTAATETAYSFVSILGGNLFPTVYGRSDDGVHRLCFWVVGEV
jgi:hypothetical protein